MGIQGLLPLLKDIQVNTHVSTFRGQTVGIDTYCWLHKGTYSCAKELILGKPTKGYVLYVMKRVNMLKRYGLKPILVFDGGYLPAKREKEIERRRNRDNYKKRGMEALREGKSQEAFDCFQKACDVTPKMASEVIKECHSMGVQCIVAPYEADAQLAYLMKSGVTQLTISEDSDLLLYGCNKVLYKMNADGDGFLVDLANLNRVRSVQLSSFTFEKFRQMCMLSGCDYLPSIKGMGLKTAHKVIKKHRTAKQCIQYLKCGATYTVPKNYIENFEKSEAVFKYQLVFDPKEKKIVPLNEIEEGVVIDEETLNFAGPKIDENKALQIALGNIDPNTGEVLCQFDDFAKEETTNIVQKEKNEKSAFHFKQTAPVSSKSVARNQHTPVEIIERQSPPTIDMSSADCTPTDTEKCEEMRPLVKCLDKVLDSYSDATRSLQILDGKHELDKQAKASPIKKLFGKPSIAKTSSNSSKSVWLVAKKQSKHKYKNPFRIQANQDEKSHEVKSCYFDANSNVNGIETSNKTDELEPNSLNSSINNSDSPNSSINEPLMFNKDVISKTPGAFLEYLDNHNVSMTTRKRLTLDTLDNIKVSPKKNVSPRKKLKSRKSNDISSILSRYTNHVHSSKETNLTTNYNTDNKENKKDPVFILTTPEKTPSIVGSDDESRSPLSPVVCSGFQSSNTSSKLSIDFNIVSSCEPELICTGTYSPSDQELDEDPLTLKKSSSLPSMKIGLNKNNRNKSKTNSSVLKITNMLETFKRLDKNSLPTLKEESSHKNVKSETLCKDTLPRLSKVLNIPQDDGILQHDVEIIYSDDEEEVLPKVKPMSLKKDVNGYKLSETKGRMERCKSLGLSRKRKAKTSFLSQDNKKQTKLTLDKFKFEKKSLCVS